MPQQPPSSYDIKTSVDETAAEMDERSAVSVAREIDGFLGRLTAKAPQQARLPHTPHANCRSLNPGELAHDQAARFRF
ncbi:hypothetical protein JQ634_11845 [Bradyrhizobium sp. AUGA SZCCT0240]|uniref:hypothetical protein n=1 Tax=unclassified Bradyrhizobium TaxID=2631580 RepID=UPI001BA6B44F|nr:MULTISPECIES: hypothetical protein [unclassified Bradyrhizobium]MBR1197744.1 hypothetical protein [Bradyrhizobium sp. AUGA SZCCT0158]MBR1254397.1 hypothetical protein [Bradyrhizobium sp. AUGA SZCCT0240]